MTERRALLSAAALGTAAFLARPAAAQTAPAARPAGALPVNGPSPSGRWRPPQRLGLGCQPLSNGFGKVVPPATAIATVESAWDSGIRLFDTSPWYGLGRSERRIGTVLSTKPRDAFTLSTKVGRVLEPDAELALRRVANWAEAPAFRYRYDYSADGTRRSIEDSLQRLGLSRIDIVFVHDLSPGNERDLGRPWREAFEEARKGAFPALRRMKEEGIIRAWGMGVNDPEPILAALEVAEPDIFLAATQYSLAEHGRALDGIIPAVQAKGVSLMIGAPLNGGFLAGKERFDYGPAIPEPMRRKRARMQAVAAEHGVDLRTAALRFLDAQPAVSCFVPGASHPDQPRQNAESFRAAIPAAFWSQMKEEGLIDRRAPTPTA